MGNVSVPHIFDDRDWQACLVAYFENLSQQKASHRFLTEQRNILTGFFSQYRKHPRDCSPEDIEAFCNGFSYHGEPSGETVNRRKRAIRRYYLFASSYQNGHQEALFQNAYSVLPEALSRQIAVPVLFNDATWQACLVAFIEQLRSDETKVNYCNVLARFFCNPGRCPDTYTRQEIERFIRGSHASKVHNRGEPVTPSPATVNARKSCLSSFFEYSSGYQVLSDDKRLHALMQTQSPVKGIRQEKVEPTHRLLSESDLVALFKAIPLHTATGIRDRAMFMAYLFLGRRNRELRLRWQDIEPHTFTTRDGNSYQGYRYRYHAKGKGQRWLYAEMPREVYEQIEWYLLATDRLSSIQPDEGIFVQHRMTHDGRLASFSKEPLSSGSIRHILKAYCKSAHVDPCVCVHSFRHANAAWRYRCGEGIMEICKALGHSNVAVTHRYIQEVTAENDTGAPALAAKLGHLLNV